MSGNYRPCHGAVVGLWPQSRFRENFNNSFFGGSEYFFPQGVNSVPNSDYGYWVSQNVYAMYQLMFAIITPALIVGAIAERKRLGKGQLQAVCLGCIAAKRTRWGAPAISLDLA